MASRSCGFDRDHAATLCAELEPVAYPTYSARPRRLRADSTVDGLRALAAKTCRLNKTPFRLEDRPGAVPLPVRTCSPPAPIFRVTPARRGGADNRVDPVRPGVGKGVQGRPRTT